MDTTPETDTHDADDEAPNTLVSFGGYDWSFIDREGVRYLLTRPYADHERVEDCDVAALPATLAHVEVWLRDIELARDLCQRHGLTEIVFRDATPTYYKGDWDYELQSSESVPVPDWDEEARTDCDERHAQPDAIYWTAQHHYAEDIHISTEWLSLKELEALRRYLTGHARDTAHEAD